MIQERQPGKLALAAYFLRLGALGFGGPVALVAAMERQLVRERAWLSGEEYRRGIALAQLSPGPLAAQVCFYIGYLRGGVAGAAWCGLAFVLPSLVLVLALAWGYTRAQGIPQIQDAFRAVGAAVTGLLVVAASRLLRRTVGGDRLLLTIATVLAGVTVATGREPVTLIIAGGLLVWMLRVPPPWFRFRGIVPEAASGLLLLQVALFFTYAGAAVFGSGLAIVPFLHGGLVAGRGWLNEEQFRDAVAVAFVTPGPVVITTAFIGYLVAGLAGALVAAAATFLPCFMITVILAPQVERYADSPALRAIVEGVTAAAMGALAGAVLLIGAQAVRDPPGVLMAIVAAGAFAAGRVPEVVIVAGAAAAGVGLASFS